MFIFYEYFVAQLHDRELLPLLSDFAQGFQGAFEMRFFSFSSFVASTFFDPHGDMARNNALSQAMTWFEQRTLTDLLDVVQVSAQDVAAKNMPPWASPDVLPFADQFTRSFAYHTSSFAMAVHHRLLATEEVKTLLAASHRSTTAMDELRNMAQAFASLALLVKVLMQTNGNYLVDPTHTPIAVLYIQRVVERFRLEAPFDFAPGLRFNGPSNPIAPYMPDEPLYLPVRPSTPAAHHSLCKLIVAAHRVLTGSSAPARDILTWTQFVLNAFHTSPEAVWSASVESVRIRTAMAAEARVASAAASAGARAGASAGASASAAVDIMPPPTPRAGAPRVPQAAKKSAEKTAAGPKTTLRLASPTDNF